MDTIENLLFSRIRSRQRGSIRIIGPRGLMNLHALVLPTTFGTTVKLVYNDTVQNDKPSIAAFSSVPAEFRFNQCTTTIINFKPPIPKTIGIEGLQNTGTPEYLFQR
ncbi:hypothetical protein AVEN_208176-1 [Araneus ventricosus]|uniref:Uncharacterized protein n=1 Tax=Araneus ventricosus TaxID=182803 RepID=A0A4Y2RGY0_ARAVE|nr:hypothetical protein AVEN_208176-1 [Araneus ventricosus]